MADKLPRTMVIKSLASGHGYAYSRKEEGNFDPTSGAMLQKAPNLIFIGFDCNPPKKEAGKVRCREESAFSPLAKIEVEESTTHPNCVHLRFSHTNKYWAKGPNNDWIIATATKPEEDTSKPSCTLFEPIINSDGHLCLIHLQSRLHVRADHNTACMYASETYEFAFKVVDWDELVKLPERVTFKGYNNKYMQLFCCEDHKFLHWKCEEHQYLQFSGEDSNAKSVSYEVVLNPEGYLRIKSGCFGKFLRLDKDGWIWADSLDETSDTLFWPVKVDDRTIALRSAGNNNFCIPHNADGKTECLNANADSIIHEAKLVVEELVLERSIYNVRYRTEDSRISDEEAFLAGHACVLNEGDLESSGNVKISYTNKVSHSFDHSLSITGGAKTTITVGIPCLVAGQIEFSLEVTKSFEWGTATEQSSEADASCAVKIPPRSQIRIDYVGTRAKYNIPFSYTQKDKRSGDGAYVTSNHIDGIFTGVNNYDFRFVQHAAQPL